MSKQSVIQRDFKRTVLVKKHLKKRQSILKKLRNEQNLNIIFLLQKKLQRLPGNSLPIRLKNRCWKTGRGRSVYRDFGLSRHVLREMAHQCLLPGVVKSSW